MLPELGRIGPITLRTYSLMLDVAIIIGLGVMTWHGWRAEDRHTRWLDAGLAAVGAAIMGGRLEHVVIHNAYFADHLAEIPQVWLGGLEWHLALVFGLIGLWLACRLWKIRFLQAVDVLAGVVPLGAALIFGGCWMSACGYGREVASLADYPAFVAAELPDTFGIVAPRLNAQLFGVIASLALFGVSIFIGQRLEHRGARFWIVLALLAAILFALGATRGDPMPMAGPLRLDQALDLAVAALALGGVFLSLRQTARATLTKGR